MVEERTNGNPDNFLHALLLFNNDMRPDRQRVAVCGQAEVAEQHRWIVTWIVT